MYLDLANNITFKEDLRAAYELEHQEKEARNSPPKMNIR